MIFNSFLVFLLNVTNVWRVLRNRKIPPKANRPKLKSEDLSDTNHKTEPQALLLHEFNFKQLIIIVIIFDV